MTCVLSSTMMLLHLSRLCGVQVAWWQFVALFMSTTAAAVWQSDSHRSKCNQSTSLCVLQDRVATLQAEFRPQGPSHVQEHWVQHLQMKLEKRLQQWEDRAKERHSSVLAKEVRQACGSRDSLAERFCSVFWSPMSPGISLPSASLDCQAASHCHSAKGLD